METNGKKKYIGAAALLLIAVVTGKQIFPVSGDHHSDDYILLFLPIIFTFSPSGVK